MESVFNSIISGMVVPFVAAVFTKSTFSKRVNVAIVTALCVAIAAIQQYFAGKLGFDLSDGQTILASIGVIATVSQGFYQLFKGTVQGIEAGVENAIAAPNVPAAPAKSDLVKESAKVLLTDEINRQIEQQVSERITRIMGVKDVMPVAEDESEEVFDDYERVAG